MKLNKLISVVCAALIALTTIIYSAVPAFASSDTTEETWVESTFDGIATALWNMTGAALKSSYDTFVDGLLAVGWYYDADIYALVDPTSDCMYGLTVDGVLVRERSGGSSGRGRQRVDSADDVIIGSETFTHILERLQAQYGYNIGSDDYKILSWQNEVNPYHITDFALYQQGVGLPVDGTECYFVGFYYDGSQYYFSREQYHFCIDITDDSRSFRCGVFDMLDTTVTEYSYYSWNPVPSLTSYPYVMISSDIPSYGRDQLNFSVHFIPDYDRFINPYAYNWAAPYIAPAWLGYNNFYSDIYTYVTWASVASQFTAKPVGGEAYDVGFVVSAEPMKEYLDDIDTTKISTDGTVSMGGDTIYDYTITNSSGDSTTINEYVTNNYTYITNNNGDDSGSSDSGSTSGNVIVGGNVAVDGAIDVNINVNDDDFVTPDTNLVENLPKEPTEFTDYLAILFAKLPVEVLGLILGGIAAAIFCRVWGR